LQSKTKFCKGKTYGDNRLPSVIWLYKEGNALPPTGVIDLKLRFKCIKNKVFDRLPLLTSPWLHNRRLCMRCMAMHCPFLHRRGYITEGYVCDVWQSIKNKVETKKKRILSQSIKNRRFLMHCPYLLLLTSPSLHNRRLCMRCMGNRLPSLHKKEKT